MVKDEIQKGQKVSGTGILSTLCSSKEVQTAEQREDAKDS